MTEVVKAGDFNLRCTLRAAKEICAQYGSYTEALRRVEAFDHAAFVAIIALGTGRARAEVDDEVFKYGLPKLAKPVADFIVMLLHGGRDPSENTGGTDSGNERG